MNDNERHQIVELFKTDLRVAENGDVCQCGTSIKDHTFGDGHLPVPMMDELDGVYIQGRLNALRDVAKLLKIDLPEPEDQDLTSLNPRFHRTEPT